MQGSKWLVMILALMLGGGLATVTSCGGDGDGDADTDVDGDGDGDTDTDTDTDIDASSGDADGDGDGSSESDGDADSDADEDEWPDGDLDFEDPACVWGHDPANPALRLRHLNPTRPAVLRDAQPEIQDALDSEATIYLLTIEDITGDGDFAGSLGPGVTRGRGYAYDPEVAPSSFDVTITGDSFTSPPEGIDMNLIFSGLVGGISLAVPVREAVMDGTFTTPERCSVGEQLTTIPPTDWNSGGNLNGLLAVEDAQSTTFNVFGFIISLCAFVAYDPAEILSNLLTADLLCADPQETWDNPPDATTADGDPAWLVESTYAATACIVE